MGVASISDEVCMYTKGDFPFLGAIYIFAGFLVIFERNMTPKNQINFKRK